MPKLGSYPIPWKGISLADRLRAMQEAGFEVICAGSSKGFCPDPPPETLTLPLAEKYGFAIENVHLDSRGSHSLWADGPQGDEVCERYLDEIARCAGYGVLCGVAHVTWGIDPPPPVSDAGLDRFRRIAECAVKHDFRVAFENSISAQHLRAVLDGIRCDHVGYCFDSGHRNCFCPEEDLIADYGDRLFAMHMQDNDGMRDLHMIPLDGCAPFAEIRDQLTGTQLYRHSVTLEAGGIVRRECPGKNADEIRSGLSRISIREDDRLLHIWDGGFSIYEDLSFEEYLDRAVSAAAIIAGRRNDAH